jgi:hypothetical protein
LTGDFLSPFSRLAAFGSYSEYAVFDPDTRTLTARPVGWELAEYQPSGPVEGRDELKLIIKVARPSGGELCAM